MRPLILVALVWLSGCLAVSGSGVQKTEARAVPAFSRLEVASAIQLTGTVGPETTLTLTGDDNLLPLVETFVSNGTLFVRVKDGAMVLWPATITARLTTPRLEGVVASGASSVDLTATATSADFPLEASGASTLRLAGLASPAVVATVSGSSHVELAGASATLRAEVSGASELLARELPVDRSTVVLTGSSYAKLRAAVAVSGEASGASTLEVIGPDASLSVTTSGASDVRRVTN